MARERIVVVGCGSIGRRHASLLSQRTDVALELCDVVDENLVAARDAVGNVPIHRAYEDVLNTRPAMVVIATPPSLHAEQTIAALRAGIHVLCEKPMSDSLDDARRMMAADESSHCVLDVGFVLHFHPGLRTIKQMIESGKLGTISHVHWHIGTYETLARSVSRHQANTFGALAMDYAHQPDLLFWWLGTAPETVHAVACKSGDLPLSSNPNVMTLILEYPAPVLATINLNFIQDPGRAYCEITGDKAWLHFDLTSGTMRIGNREESTIEQIEVHNDRDALFRDEHQAFLDAVHSLRPPESPSRNAIQSMLVVDAAIRSLRSKKSVRPHQELFA